LFLILQYLLLVSGSIFESGAPIIFKIVAKQINVKVNELFFRVLALVFLGKELRQKSMTTYFAHFKSPFYLIYLYIHLNFIKYYKTILKRMDVNKG